MQESVACLAEELGRHAGLQGRMHVLRGELQHLLGWLKQELPRFPDVVFIDHFKDVYTRVSVLLLGNLPAQW